MSAIIKKCHVVLRVAITAWCISIALCSCSAPGLNDFPGIEEQKYNCRRICDKMQQCRPATDDAIWDACVEDCKTQGWGEATADCIDAGNCDDGYNAIVEACTAEGDDDVG